MERVRVAIVGASFGARVQGPGFSRHPGFALVGIAGSSPPSAARAGAELGVPGFDDWRRMLDETRPDLVSVVTPVDLHHPMMLEALDRGAHVLCEKPTALHRFQAAEMHDRAVTAGRVAGINHEFRWFPARTWALELVRRGDIGEPRRGEILGRYAIWPRPESRGMTWLSDARRGGGLLGALGSHHTDCFRTFFGEPRSALATVRVDQPWRGSERATADDAATVQYVFDGGATGLIDIRGCAPYRWERFEIHGAEATLRWDETGYQLWRIVAGKDPEEIPIPESHQIERHDGDLPLVAPFRVLVAKLHRAIVHGDPLDPDFRDAVAVQSALDAARLSSASNARVDVLVPPLAAQPATARPEPAART